MTKRSLYEAMYFVESNDCESFTVITKSGRQYEGTNYDAECYIDGNELKRSDDHDILDDHLGLFSQPRDGVLYIDVESIESIETDAVPRLKPEVTE